MSTMTGTGCGVWTQLDNDCEVGHQGVGTRHFVAIKNLLLHIV